VSYELEAIFDDPDVDDSTSQIIGANGENNDEGMLYDIVMSVYMNTWYF